MLYKVVFLIAVIIALSLWMYWGLWILIRKKIPPFMTEWYERGYKWIWGYKWVMERPIILGSFIIFLVLAASVLLILWWFSVDWEAFVR